MTVGEPSPYKSIKDRTPRKCLRCQKMFQSTGPGNRICITCYHNTANYNPTEYKVAASNNLKPMKDD